MKKGSNKMRIYVANLRAYNEGYLKGEWFDLPVEWEDIVHTIFDEDELDSSGNPKGDHAIHDYELPFDISEWQSIADLNDMVDVLESVVDDNVLQRILHNTFTASDLIYFADSLGLGDQVSDIVPLEFLVSQLQSDMEEGNVYSVKCKLEDVKYELAETEYYVLEGDGNFSSITKEFLDDTLDEVFKALKLDCTSNQVNAS